MATINHEITSLNVRDFLSNDKYVIPIYQRNYDWGEKEVLQLVEDVADYAKEDSNSKYYIGSAVVFVRNNNGQEYLETIDGQQRLTTLTILTILLGSMGLADWYQSINLSYDHRKDADEALLMLKSTRKYAISLTGLNTCRESLVVSSTIGIRPPGSALFSCR